MAVSAICAKESSYSDYVDVQPKSCASRYSATKSRKVQPKRPSGVIGPTHDLLHVLKASSPRAVRLGTDQLANDSINVELSPPLHEHDIAVSHKLRH